MNELRGNGKPRWSRNVSPFLGPQGSPVITYCGGGIASSLVLFAMHLVGVSSVALHDGSLVDWASQPDLPVEITDSAAPGR